MGSFCSKKSQPKTQESEIVSFFCVFGLHNLIQPVSHDFVEGTSKNDFFAQTIWCKHYIFRGLAGETPALPGFLEVPLR